MCIPSNEESGFLANNTPLTGYEPNLFDDYHNSETIEIFLQEQSSDTRPRTCMTRRSVAERSLHHCSLRSEKNQRAVDKLITLLKKVCCPQSLSVCDVRTGRPGSDQFDSLIPNVRENPCRNSENEQKSRFNVLERSTHLSLDDAASCGAEPRWHSQEFQESLEVQCLCLRRHHSAVLSLSIR